MIQAKDHQPQSIFIYTAEGTAKAALNQFGLISIRLLHYQQQKKPKEARCCTVEQDVCSIMMFLSFMVTAEEERLNNFLTGISY